MEPQNASASRAATERDPVVPASSGGEAFGRSDRWRRRRTLMVVGTGVIGAGLGVHFLVLGQVGDFAADALYAVLVYLVVALVAPRARKWHVVAAAWAVCAVIELLQLTGLPLALADLFPPSRLLLGTTFAPIDLLAYALGAAIAGLNDAAHGRLAGRIRSRLP